MITWEEFIKIKHKKKADYEITNIICPRCGKALWKNVRFVLASNPEQYSYMCFECGWTGCH